MGFSQGLESCNVSVSVSSRTKCPTYVRLGLGAMRLGSRLGLRLKGHAYISYGLAVRRQSSIQVVPTTGVE